jgi:serine/threonine-protein kinase RsbW
VKAAIRLRMPARPEYLVLGRLALTGISRVHPIDPDDLADLKLALTEACSNSMRHAYGGELGAVEIRVDLDGATIVVEVRDEGPGFGALRPRRAPEDLDEGGLGLAIIEAVTDRVEIDRLVEEKGSSLRFTKRLRPVTIE